MGGDTYHLGRTKVMLVEIKEQQIIKEIKTITDNKRTSSAKIHK